MAVKSRNIGELRIVPLITTSIACLIFAVFLFKQVPFAKQTTDVQLRETSAEVEALTERLRQISDSLRENTELQTKLQRQVQDVLDNQESISRRIQKVEIQQDALEKKPSKKR
jgi:cell shape-determining protein MreC